ncbi:MAG: hypothetical protein QOK36_4170 [Gaiellales bacterium]|jgi:2-polyprenyl-3-methyl-5-hydroxy-6-metoxy-1,4-benzoquinol methylase|nr:hypothetical protein [Gaiellales bacterium]
MTAFEVELASPHGALVYRDSNDHLENGLLRLLGLTREQLRAWLAAAEPHEGTLLARLAAGFAELKPFPRPAGEGDAAPAGPGGEAGVIWHASIAESPAFGIARSEDGGLGWLVAGEAAEATRVVDPPAYEEDYFEGDRSSSGGYGDYAAQAPWRLEKAARQVRELEAATGRASGRVLDVGCGYGYFRKALGDRGFIHEGLEVSAFGRRYAQQAYGFATHDGTLEQHVAEWRGRFDFITGFDLIEHVPDPVAFLRDVAACLAPGGCVGIKTPNLDCPEAEVFGPWYHSLKREHLVLLTPASLTAAAGLAGLEPLAVATASHLLRGFAGVDAVRGWAHTGRGADIVAWYRLPG